ncbi:MAG: hypothetical protein P9L91_07830 [Candidatus Zophobacter franzmannii]|nr:hypothetical protein [Candidatus Zophobacter franzmannii]
MIKHRKAGLSILMILLLLSAVSLFSAKAQNMTVRNLQVTDIPNDDGTGLRVSWTPLPKESRVIEYHVYRGISPDSLFLISTIPVNAKTGVSADVMYYYDSGWTQIVGVDAPAKAKKDKQPDKATSPLYKEYPHDLNVLKDLMRRTTLLYMMDIKPYYYHTKPIEKDGETYAGLKWYNGSILGKLIPSNKYYYTIVAANEQRKYFMRADMVSGIPVPNEAAAVETFYGKYLPEQGTLQFEWKHPVPSDAVSAYHVFIVDNNKLEAFTGGNYDKGTELVSTSANNAFASVKISDFPQFNYDSLNDYSFVIGCAYNGGITLSEPIKAERSKLNEFYKDTTFVVDDAPDDKGDYLRVEWGKPSAYVTGTSFLGDAKQKMLVAYEYRTNEFYDVNDIYFSFFKVGEDKPFKVHEEFYQDNKIVVPLPKDYDVAKGIRVEMSFNAKSNTGTPLNADYSLTQDLVWDDFIKSLKPSDVMYNEVNLNKTFVTVLSKNIHQSSYSISKEVIALERSLNDLSDYVKREFAIVQDIDVEKKYILIDPNISYKFDPISGSVLSVNLFPGEDKKAMTKLKTSIDELIVEKGTLTDANEIAAAEGQLEQMNAQLESMNNPLLEKVNSVEGRRSRMRMIKKSREHEKRSRSYKIMISDGKGNFFKSEPLMDAKGDVEYFYPVPNWLYLQRLPGLIAALIFGAIVFIMIGLARRGKDLYLRPIAGIQEIDNAIGRATEMGAPILFVPGLSGINDVATLAGLQILSQVAKKAAEYDTPILVPCRDVIVLPIAQEIVKEAHYEAGRPDTFDPSSVFFLTSSQFAFVAGVNGIMVREKVATNFYMGMFYAESLIMTETGNSIGAIQISGTDAVTQIPFFITTCDYTLMGEELYAAAAYLSKEPMMLGTLKGQDYFKFLILFFIVLGTLLSTMKITFLINAFPDK